MSEKKRKTKKILIPNDLDDDEVFELINDLIEEEKREQVPPTNYRSNDTSVSASQPSSLAR